jgi:hypothetical protein
MKSKDTTARREAEEAQGSEAQKACVPDRRPRCGFGYRLRQGISWLVIAAMTNLTLMPLAQAVEQSQQVARASERQSAAEAYAQALIGLKEAVRAGQTTLTTQVETLDAVRAKLESEWAALAASWQEAGIDSGVREQQSQVEAAFREQDARLRAYLQGSGTAEGRTTLLKFLEAATPDTAPSTIDLDNLPWQIQKSEARAPLEDEAALNETLQLETQTAAAATPAAVAPSRLLRGPMVPQGIKPELAATLDAPQSEEIKALAAELGNNPCRTHQWVYGNIHFYPTHGSVQGAEETLARKQATPTTSPTS